MTRFVFTTATALSTLVGVAATPAAAEGWEYLSYGVGYVHADFGSTSADFTALSLTGDYDGGQFAFSGEITASRTNSGPFSSNEVDADVLAGYRMEPELMLLFGLEVDYSEDLGARTDFSLGVEYERDAFTLGAYVEGDENDLNETVVYGAYRFSEATEASLSLSDTGSGPGSTNYTLTLDHDRGPLDLSAVWIGSTDVDGGVVGLGAMYDIGNRTRLIGGASYLDFGGGASARIYEAGAGYRVAENVWLDAAYARLDNGSPSGNEFVTLELTFERGSRVMTRDRIRETRDDASVLFTF